MKIEGAVTAMISEYPFNEQNVPDTVWISFNSFNKYGDISRTVHAHG